MLEILHIIIVLHLSKPGHGHSHNNIQLRTASLMRCPEELRKERERAEKALSIHCGF